MREHSEARSHTRRRTFPVLLALLLALPLAACERGAAPEEIAPETPAEAEPTAPAESDAAAGDEADEQASAEDAGEAEAEPTQDQSFTGTYALAADPEAPERIWFTLERGIVASEDGGLTWTVLPESKVAEGQRIGSLAFDEGARAFFAGEGVFRRSTDEGLTWTDLPGREGDDVLGMAILPGGLLLAAIHEQGVLASEDGGDSWETLTETLPASAVWGLWSLDAEGARVAMFDREAERLLVSEDGGASWDELPTEGLDSRVMHMAYSPTGTIYAATNAGLHASEDGGASWEPRGPFEMIAAVAVPADAPEAVIVVAPGGQVFRSPDGGESWGTGGADEGEDGSDEAGEDTGEEEGEGS